MPLEQLPPGLKGGKCFADSSWLYYLIWLFKYVFVSYKINFHSILDTKGWSSTNSLQHNKLSSSFVVRLGIITNHGVRYKCLIMVEVWVKFILVCHDSYQFQGPKRLNGVNPWWCNPMVNITPIKIRFQGSPTNGRGIVSWWTLHKDCACSWLLLYPFPLSISFFLLVTETIINRRRE